MFYSEWISSFKGTVIGFFIHEQPITYGSNWERYSGFYIDLGPIRKNKKVRPKIRILKIHGGYYVNNVDHGFYVEYVKFLSMNQKLTPEEENVVRIGIKAGKI